MVPTSSHLHDRSGYLAQDTVAAIGTSVGGAISMIRVSGPQAFEALNGLLGREVASLPRTLTRARIKAQDGQDLDDALFARFVTPDSYTGEDVVELHLHGGAYLASRVMGLLREQGVRQALPGEFSFRAVRNGKMSLTQAQAVADLIAASNDGALTLALEKLSGTQHRQIERLATSLRQLAVLGEAGIDFADQDIEEVGLPRLKSRLAEPIDTLRALQSSYDRGTRVQEGISAAFVGLPNAGKSSFFNALLGQDRSIVSEVAGTTRDVVHERITLRGQRGTVTLRLEDTAGLRHADDPIEAQGIERTRKSARDADLVLFLVEPASPLQKLQEQWEALGRPVAKAIGILTKSDLGPPPELHQLGISRWISTSAQTGQGISEAIDAITELGTPWTQRAPGEVLLTRQDHLAAVQEALEHLTRAAQAPEIDLFAADLRQALHALGPLIGQTLPDDILGKIFSEFCIGK